MHAHMIKGMLDEWSQPIADCDMVDQATQVDPEISMCKPLAICLMERKRWECCKIGNVPWSTPECNDAR